MKRVLVLAAMLGCSKGAQPDDHLIHRTDSSDHTVIRGKGVDISTLGLEAKLMLPISGKADIDVDVKAPANKGSRDYSHATGHIIFHCTACRLGDDKATLELPSGRASVLAGPLYVGHIDFDRIDVEIGLADGKANVKTFNVASKDIEISVAGGATLEKILGDMRVDLCLRFKPTDALAKRDVKTDALIRTTGAAQAADGFFHIKLTDRLSSMKKLAMICDGSAPAPSMVPDPPPATSQANTPPTPPLDPTLIAAGIKKLDDTHYEIDHTLIEKILADPMSIASGARVVPAVGDGKPVGFKIYAIKADSLYAALGLLNGDTIRNVNGFDLSSADKALEVYTKLRDLTASRATLTVDLERRGTPTTLSYRIR